MPWAQAHPASELQERLGRFDGRLAELKISYENLCAQNILLKTKVFDVESCSRRHNIKIMGLERFPVPIFEGWQFNEIARGNSI